MRKVIAGMLVALAAVGATAFGALEAGASTGGAMKPHIVGTWADDTNLGASTGGWELWSNGRVVALQGAADFGGAASHKLNDFVGMVGDTLGDGYWLVTSTGQVFPFGSVCLDKTLKRPRGVPASGIVGAVNLMSQTVEGFDLVSSNGAVFPFRCVPLG